MGTTFQEVNFDRLSEAEPLINSGGSMLTRRRAIRSRPLCGEHGRDDVGREGGPTCRHGGKRVPPSAGVKGHGTVMPLALGSELFL